MHTNFQINIFIFDRLRAILPGYVFFGPLGICLFVCLFVCPFICLHVCFFVLFCVEQILMFYIAGADIFNQGQEQSEEGQDS